LFRNENFLNLFIEIFKYLRVEINYLPPQGPGLYYVDSDGQRTKGQVFSVGSGSLYAYGVLDEGYKFDMSVEEAIELGRRSIYHATFRDAVSGGTVSVYHVTESGWTKVRGDDVGELHYQYYKTPESHPTYGEVL
jgi:20S proteasome subunit beta 5